MARLEWNNVANPDFTAAASLQQSASRDIANALTGIGTFVDGVANRNNAQNQKALELFKLEAEIKKEVGESAEDGIRFNEILADLESALK